MDSDLSNLTEVGERELIARLAAYFGPTPEGEVWSGDDAAVVDFGNSKLLLTTDALVEGVDFNFGYSTGYDVGWKALAVNVSDIAAMGGRPAHAVITVGAPTWASTALLEEVARGIAEAAERWRVAVVGGDVTRAQYLLVNVALTGALIRERPVLRSGATVGDALCVTGRLGGSAGGLLALQAGLDEDDDDALQGLIKRHRRPSARTAEAAVITNLGPTAMIDISDGLGRDLSHLVEASDVGCEVEIGSVPIDPRLDVLAQKLPATIDEFELALAGGEDYELLFTIDPDRVDEMCTRLADLGAPATQIGTITSGPRNVGDEPLETWRDKGWDHLRNP